SWKTPPVSQVSAVCLRNTPKCVTKKMFFHIPALYFLNDEQPLAHSGTATKLIDLPVLKSAAINLFILCRGSAQRSNLNSTPLH
ncbi:MAG: hypothetical protein J6D44_17620, partial [Pseudomonas sp.]|nr:hypothetical protein [Pseudomonas sp.]